ncbi:MAG: transposase [Deltaproteobacteria bacterium]|nr:transposase [Deltaproteobacteria bacterium]
MTEEKYKTYHHIPPHLFRPKSKYFITGSTYKSRRIIRGGAKDRLLNSLTTACSAYDWILEDWVILDNHYHIMLEAPENPSTLSNLIRDMHKFTALWIKKHITQSRDLPHVFHNYWDTCITYERSYFARLNYIYYNPVKHGYASLPEEYAYGSYRTRFLDARERQHLMAMKERYPFDKVKVKDDF